MPTEPTQAETLKELVALASQARGLEITTIANVAEIEGLPEQIPVGIRHGVQPEVVDLSRLFEPWRARPAAKRGTATTLTLQSFIDLTNRHRTRHSAIFANTDWRKPSLLAVVDYHEVADVPEIKLEDITITPAGACDPADAAEMATAFVYKPPRPDNLRHRIAYAYPLSYAWKEWVEKDGEMMTQGDFAAWIEDHIADLASPEKDEKDGLESDFQTTMATPAALIQISRGLQINVEAKVKNVVTLQSGAAQIAFEETHLGGDGKPLVIPGLFLLQVAPFFGGAVVRVPVRLRYRVVGGVTKWLFSMYRPDQFITERLREDIRLVTEATELPIFEGTPETSD